MRGGRWGLLAVVMVMMMAALCGQTMRGQATQPRAETEVGDGSALRTDTPGPHGRARVPVPSPVRPGGLARPVAETILFPQMARAAGAIFSGTVTKVARRKATRGQTLETVAITFHVERAIRGATPGEEFTVSQWIGLWSNGQRYRVGERVLLFLYPPSKLGLTSCVAAPMGRFAVDGAGRVLLTAQHLSAFRANPVLGGKSRAQFSDFALAVRQASGEE